MYPVIAEIEHSRKDNQWDQGGLCMVCHPCEVRMDSAYSKEYSGVRMGGGGGMAPQTSVTEGPAPGFNLECFAFQPHHLL
jgi:hypothetical protein